MPGDEDGVVLSDREREVLADLAARLDDPWLAQQLRGVDGPPPAPAPPLQLPTLSLQFQAPAVPRRRRRRASGRRRPANRLHRWAGAVLIIIGVLIHLATFTFSPWIAALQVAVMAGGTWLLWHDRITFGRHTEPPPENSAGP